MDISESTDPQQIGQQQQAPQPMFGPENFQRPPQQSNIMDETMDSRPIPEMDIDSNLLQQFSCLGTTDHEDLVNDFQRLLDNQLSKETARFFLEMSNWNLQTAVCCYLDFCNFQNIPSMKITSQSRPTAQSQAWRLQNDGTEDWPAGCYLMSPSQTKRLEVPVVRPGETCDIVADIPPSSPAIMWRLCTPNGWYFGDSDKVDICEQLIRWSDILVELQNLPKAEKVLIKALKYGYACQSVQHRCLILLKQALTYHRLNNVDRSIKKFKRALEIADEYEFDELRALTRMHYGFIHSKEGERLKYGIRLLTEAIEIFKEMDNMEQLQQAEYYLAISKANQIFDDVCSTIRDAAKVKGPQNPSWNKWKNWQFRKAVIWNCKPSIEEVEEDLVSNDTDVEDPVQDSLSVRDRGMHKKSMAEFFRSRSKVEYDPSVGPSSFTLVDEQQDINGRIDSVVLKLKNISTGETGLTPNPVTELFEETAKLDD